MTAGHLPFLLGLSRGTHQLRSLYSGLPATTPSVQGELFYGVRQCVCNWNFRERHSGQIVELLERPAAARREYELARQGPGLLEGGAAYVSLMSGGAAELHFCANSEDCYPGWLNPRLWSSGREAWRALKQTLKGAADWRQWRDELLFLPKRVAINVILTEHLRCSIQNDLERGLPIVYANLLGYDCLAHQRGPHSPYARQVLPRIDRVLSRLWESCQEHNYQLWIFSDHGQEKCGFFAEEGQGALAEILSGRVENLQVADSSPVAHVYFDGGRPAELAEMLVVERGVPQVMYLGSENEVLVRNRYGLFRLPEQWSPVLGRKHPFASEVVTDLVSLARHPEAGRLIALGWHRKVRLTFLRERGSHGGPGPLETHAFTLLPREVELPKGLLRAGDLRKAALKLRSRPT